MAWTYSGWWAVVLGASRSADDVVKEFELSRAGIAGWLDEAQSEAGRAGGLDEIPEEWAAYATRALGEMEAACGRLFCLEVDAENSASTWWDALRASQKDAPRALRALLGKVDRVDLPQEELGEVLRFAQALPGWTGGPRYAPHPLCVVEVDPT